MRYTLEVSENQMRLIQKALESYERERMGQFGTLADDLASFNFTYDKDDPNNDENFREYISRRDKVREYFDRGYKEACPWVTDKTDEMMVAEDMWMELRYQLWKDRPGLKSYNTVESRGALRYGIEPLIKINQVKEKEHE